MARCPHGRCARGKDGGHGPSPRRIRYRQGSHRSPHSPSVAAETRPVRGHKLRGTARTTARVRVVWVRTRCVHGRPAVEGGTHRVGSARGPVPRGGERDEPGGAGEAPTF